MNIFPENFKLLHQGEEEIYSKSITLIEGNDAFLLHVDIIHCALDIFDVLRQFPEENDEDFKVIQFLGLRLFNAFASSLKLMLSGYYQNSALIMRDVLETVFLLDMFRTKREAITEWRFSDKALRQKKFKPVKVREYLDNRDGYTSKKRAEMYDIFSELAGHPNLQSIVMIKPGGLDAHNGPFLDPKMLESTLAEMARLAVQAGEIADAFFPKNWLKGKETSSFFSKSKKKWLSKFYPKK